MFHFHRFENHQCLACFNGLPCSYEDFENHARHWCNQASLMFIAACSCFDAFQCEDSTRVVNPPNVTNFGNMCPCLGSIFEIDANTSIFARMCTMVRKRPDLRRTLEQYIVRLSTIAEFMLHQGYLLLSVWNGLATPAEP